ncbi:MAG: hypothetical protein ACREA2_08985, partial [Blastocatellia bacterium]
MKKALMISTVALVFAVIGLLARGGAASSPVVQETISGDWTAKVKQTDRGPALWLSLSHGPEERHG